MNIRLILVLILVSFSVVSSITQAIPDYDLRWAEANQKEIRAPIVDSFPEAPIVILADYGDNRIADNNIGLEYIFTHHRRIKICKAIFFDPTVCDIYYEEAFDKIRNVKALIYYPNGQIIQLRKKEIINESADGWGLTYFDWPTIVDGAIIEYRYQIRSTFIDRLRTWHFQGELPRMWSKVELHTPLDVNFHIVPKGQIDSLQDGKIKVETERKFSKSYYFTMAYQGTLKEQPYVYNLLAHNNGLDFYFDKYAVYEQNFPKQVSWQEKADNLLAFEYFGKQFQNSSYFQEVLQTIGNFPQQASELEKLMFLYQYVNENLKWNGFFTKYCSDNLKDVFQSGEGSSADLNLFLIGLLRAADIIAFPTLIRTRDLGPIRKSVSCEEQLNHILVFTEVDSQVLIVEAGDTGRLLGELNELSFVHEAFIIGDSRSFWVNIKLPQSEQIYLSNMVLDENGSLKNQLLFDGKDTYAKVYRRLAEENNLRNVVVDKILSSTPRMTIDTFHIVQNLPKREFRYQVNYSISNYPQILDSTIVIKPPYFTEFSRNLLQNGSRTLPIEFKFPFREKNSLKITWPAAFQLVQKPENLELKLDEIGLTFHFEVQQNANELTFISVVESEKVQINELYFSQVFEFFNLVAEHLQIPMILRTNGITQK